MSRNRHIDLSPKLKLGIGKRPRSYAFVRYSSTFIVLLLFLFGLQMIMIKIKTTTASENSGKVLSAQATMDERYAEIEVTKRDNLYSVGKKYNVQWTTIADINNLKAPFVLKDGQKLKIPKN